MKGVRAAEPESPWKWPGGLVPGNTSVEDELGANDALTLGLLPGWPCTVRDLSALQDPLRKLAKVPKIQGGGGKSLVEKGQQILLAFVALLHNPSRTSCKAGTVLSWLQRWGNSGRAAQHGCSVWGSTGLTV